ncbi:MAG: hypothetical protein NTV12_04520 [Verrucomicrobia bacterium]|nr:hypothetical protein [Verrucomicrobiota bacterium]
MALKTNSAVIMPPPVPSKTTNSMELRPAKPLEHIQPRWPWVAAGLLLALIAGFLAWWWWNKKRNGQAKVVILIPPHRRAKDRLHHALSLLADPYAFCSLLSEVLRIYLEERFSLHAPERTTEEFLHELQATELLNDNQKVFLEDFLRRCDLVKFAQHEPTEPELRELLESALRLIDETQMVDPIDSSKLAP